MNESNVVELKAPAGDALGKILKEGARQLLVQAIEKVPKIRDRFGQGIKFTSKLVPPYLKRTKHVEEFFRWLYLKGISTGELQPALEGLLGEGATGPVGRHSQPPQAELGGGLPAMAAARSEPAALRVCVGRRGSTAIYGWRIVCACW